MDKNQKSSPKKIYATLALLLASFAISMCIAFFPAWLHNASAQLVEVAAAESKGPGTITLSESSGAQAVGKTSKSFTYTGATGTVTGTATNSATVTVTPDGTSGTVIIGNIRSLAVGSTVTVTLTVAESASNASTTATYTLTICPVLAGGQSTSSEKTSWNYLMRKNLSMAATMRQVQHIAVDQTTLVSNLSVAHTSVGTGVWASYDSGDKRITFYTNGVNSKIVLPANSSYMFSHSRDDYQLRALLDIEISKFDTSNVTNMAFMFLNCWRLTSLDLSNFKTGSVTSMKYIFGSCSALTSLDLSSFNTSKVTDMSSMFSECGGLASISLSSFNTSRVTLMNGMFYNCRALTSLNLSSFNTSEVTLMNSMFYNCSILTSLNLSSFSTSNVTDMSSMFSSCSALVRLDISSFNFGGITSIDGAYDILNGCTGLREIVVPASHTATYLPTLPSGPWYVQDGSSSTSYASGANLPLVGTTIARGYNVTFDINGGSGTTDATVAVYGGQFNHPATTLPSSPTKSGYMFAGWCLTETNDNGTGDVITPTTVVTKTADFTLYAKWEEIPKEPGTITLSESSGAQAVGQTSKSFTYTGATGTVTGTATNSATVTVTPDGTSGTVTIGNIGSLAVGSTVTVTLTVAESASNDSTTATYTLTIGPVLAGGQASGSSDTTSWNYLMRTKLNVPMEDVEHIVVDQSTLVSTLGTLNTNYCSVGTGVWGAYNSSNCTITFYTNGVNSKIFLPADSRYMFSHYEDYYRLVALLDIEISKFDTSNVTSMECMFRECRPLTSLDLSSFDTSNVTNMGGMFYVCYSLTSLNLSNFNTSNVTMMPEMFYWCSALTSLNLSSFNTSNVTNMTGMFLNCSSLTSLNLSSFNTSNVTDMSYMFRGCRALTSLNLSSFNTSNVTNMASMFERCSALTSLNLSSFNTSNVTNMASMFQRCSALTSLNLSSFNTSNVTSISNMFQGCTTLAEIWTPKAMNTEHPDLVTVYYDYDNPSNHYTTLQSSQLHLIALPTLAGGQGSEDGDTTSWNYLMRTKLSVTMEDVEHIVVDQSTLVSTLGTLNTNYCSVGTGVWGAYNSSNCTITFYTNGVNSKIFLPADSRLMFSDYDYQLYGLLDIEISKFDTSNVTSIYGMFYGCSALTRLNISSFNFGSITSASYMLGGCTVLREIVVPASHTATDLPTLPSGPWYVQNGSSSTSYASGANLPLLGTTIARGYTVTFDINGGTGTTNNTVAVYGGQFNHPATTLPSNPTKEGYNFLGWCLTEEDNNGTGDVITPTTVVTPTADFTLYAKWEVAKDPGTITLSASSGAQAYGQTSKSFTYTGASGTVTGSATNGATVTVRPNGTSGTVTIGNIGSLAVGSTVTVTLTVAESANNDSTTATYTLTIGPVLAGGQGQALSGGGSDTTSWNYLMRTNLGVTMSQVQHIVVDQSTLVSTLGTLNTNYCLVGTGVWGAYNTSTKTITFYTNGVNSKIFLPADSSYMFSDYVSNRLRALLDIEISKFDTSNVTDMRSMFYYCVNLTSLNLSSFDTSNVTRMSSIFNGCDNLTLLDLSSFDTSNVTEMTNMFYQCRNLTSLNLSSFDTSNVTQMQSMFYNCSSLTTLDLRPFDTRSVSSGGMSGMLSGCSALLEIWTPDVMGSEHCAFYTGYYDVNNPSNVYATLQPSKLHLMALPTLNSLWKSTISTNLSVTMTQVQHIVIDQTTLVNDLGPGTYTSVGLNVWGAYNTSTKRITIYTNGVGSKVFLSGDAYGIFSGLSALVDIDIAKFDTQMVYNMGFMFGGCSSLASLDLSGFNTQGAGSMNSLFYGCSVLTSLDLSSFDTSNVTDMNGMFGYCSALTSLDLSSFDTSSVGGMEDMFKNCTALTWLDLSSFNFEYTNDWDGYTPNALSGCTALREIVTPVDHTIGEYTINLPSGPWYVQNGSSNTSYASGDNLPFLSTAGNKVTIARSIAVTFDKNGGTGTTNNTVAVYGGQYNHPITTLPSNPTKEGYNFVGWCLTEENDNGTGDVITPTTVVTPTADFTLYAKWEAAKEPGTITLSASSGTQTYGRLMYGFYFSGASGTVTGTATNGATVTVMQNGASGSIDIENISSLNAGTTVTVTLTVAETDDNFSTTATYTLTITQAAGSISYATTSVTKSYGSANFTNALTNTGDGTVTYASSNTNVATVNSAGLVTIKGAGSATITATVEDGTNYTYATKTASYTLTVKKANGNISYETTSVEKTYGDAAFTNALTKSGDGTVTYTSSDTNVATVAANGQVTIVKAGSATITATVTDGTNYTYATKSRSYTLTVKKASGSISYETTLVTKSYGEEAFTNALTKSGDGTVTYTSSDTNVATVAANGQVTIVKAGSAIIRATVEDGTNYTYATKTASYTLTVNKISGDISYATASVVKVYGDPAFTNELTNTGDGTVTYASSDTNVATVAANGQVTIVGAGSATITATVTDGTNFTYASTTAQYTLTVNKANGNISYETTLVTKSYGEEAFTNALTKSGDGTVTYTSSNTNVATVDSTGEVTIVKAGSATITATVADGTNYTYESNTASYTLTINKAIGSISYATTSVTKSYGSANFTNALTKTGDGTVTYSSSKTNVATVDAYGEVTIVGSGSATITATVADGTNFTYEVKTATYDLYIVSAVEKPTVNTNVYTYDGSAHAITFVDEIDSEKISITGNSATSAGQHAVLVQLVDPANFQWSDGTTTAYNLTLTINKASVAKLVANTHTFDYDGQSHSMTFTANYDSNIISVTGNSATSAGQHAVLVSLIDPVNYQWSDGTIAPYNLTLTISPSYRLVATLRYDNTCEDDATGGVNIQRVDVNSNNIGEPTGHIFNNCDVANGLTQSVNFVRLVDGYYYVTIWASTNHLATIDGLLYNTTTSEMTINICITKNNYGSFYGNSNVASHGGNVTVTNLSAKRLDVSNDLTNISLLGSNSENQVISGLVSAMSFSNGNAEFTKNIKSGYVVLDSNGNIVEDGLPGYSQYIAGIGSAISSGTGTQSGGNNSGSQSGEGGNMQGGNENISNGDGITADTTSQTSTTKEMQPIVIVLLAILMTLAVGTGIAYAFVKKKDK